MDAKKIGHSFYGFSRKSDFYHKLNNDGCIENGMNIEQIKYMLNASIKNACLKFVQEYIIVEPCLLINTILKMQQNGMWHVSNFKVTFFSHLANVFSTNEKCQQLILNPKILWFNPETIKQILGLFQACNNRSINYMVSMDNQWAFIDRWSKFQIILKTQINVGYNYGSKAATKIINDDDAKQNDKTVSMRSLEDGESDGDSESKTITIEAESNLNSFHYEVKWINERIQSLNMENDDVLAQWGNNMLKLIKYIKFDAMNPIYFAKHVWPKLIILAKNTNDDFVKEIVSNQAALIDGWYSISH